MRPEFRRSCAMELSRSALEALGHRVVLRRAFGWSALEHAEREEAGKRRQAKHQRGLLAGEIGRRPDEVLDRLVAQILRELPRTVRRTAHEASELRSVLIEILGGAVRGLHDMIDHVGAGGNLHVEKTLRLFGRVGRKRRGALLRWAGA